MFSIALSVIVFHTLASLGVLAAFALDNARPLQRNASSPAMALSAFEPTDEQILMMQPVATSPRPQPESAQRSTVAHAA
jgi:hypothetical protein